MTSSIAAGDYLRSKGTTCYPEGCKGIRGPVSIGVPLKVFCRRCFKIFFSAAAVRKPGGSERFGAYRSNVQVFAEWRSLVTTFQVKGSKVAIHAADGNDDNEALLLMTVAVVGITSAVMMVLLLMTW